MIFRRLFFAVAAAAALFVLQKAADAKNIVNVQVQGGGARSANDGLTGPPETPYGSKGCVEEFLKQTTLSDTEQTDIVKAIQSQASQTEPSRTEWVLSGGGEVYSLVLVPVQKDKRADIQTKLEEVARAKAGLRAHYLLYLRAWSQSGRKTRYANEEIVAETLAGWDKGRGVRLKPGLSVGAVSKDWAFALLKIPEEPLNTLGTQIDEMPEDALDTDYCAALYPKARELFNQRRYEQALSVYRELHSLRWAKPVAYLDAAECFLRMGDPKSAVRLVQESATELEDLMDSALLERAGDIAFESGEEASAERLYRQAGKKLQQEP
jgi:tetratricopeptide (TPR) repeat protein